MFSSIIRCFQVEWLKSRHTPLLLVHVLFPVIGAGVFAGYFHISGWNDVTNVTTFLEVLSIIFPFVIGIVVGMVVELENGAGHFQLILGTFSGIYWKIIISCCFGNPCNNTWCFLICSTLSSYAVFILYKTFYYVNIVCNTNLSYFYTCRFQFREKCSYGHGYCRKSIICIVGYRTW